MTIRLVPCDASDTWVTGIVPDVWRPRAWVYAVWSDGPVTRFCGTVWVGLDGTGGVVHLSLIKGAIPAREVLRVTRCFLRDIVETGSLTHLDAYIEPDSPVAHLADRVGFRQVAATQWRYERGTLQQTKETCDAAATCTSCFD